MFARNLVRVTVGVRVRVRIRGRTRPCSVRPARGSGSAYYLLLTAYYLLLNAHQLEGAAAPTTYYLLLTTYYLLLNAHQLEGAAAIAQRGQQVAVCRERGKLGGEPGGACHPRHQLAPRRAHRRPLAARICWQLRLRLRHSAHRVQLQPARLARLPHAQERARPAQARLPRRGARREGREVGRGA